MQIRKKRSAKLQKKIVEETPDDLVTNKLGARSVYEFDFPSLSAISPNPSVSLPLNPVKTVTPPSAQNFNLPFLPTQPEVSHVPERSVEETITASIPPTLSHSLHISDTELNKSLTWCLFQVFKLNQSSQ